MARKRVWRAMTHRKPYASSPGHRFYLVLSDLVAAAGGGELLGGEFSVEAFQSGPPVGGAAHFTALPIIFRTWGLW